MISSNEPATIGIIGGADGPTAIFLASQTNWLAIVGCVGIIVVAIAALIIYRYKKKK